MFLELQSKDRKWTAPTNTDYAISKLPTRKPTKKRLWLHVLKISFIRQYPSYDTVIVGGWDSISYLQLLWLGKAQNKTVILFYESTLNSRRYFRGPISWVRSWAFKVADYVIVPGEESRVAVLESTKGSVNPITAFNPIDVPFFTRKNTYNTAGEKGHKFLYVGRFIDLKNVDGLVRAFAAIADLKDTLTIAGFGDGESRLKSLAESLLPGQIKFVGRLDYEELPAFYEQFHTHVLPSKEREVWGMVVAEALSMGLHSVVSDKCGILTSIKEMPGVFGFNPAKEGDLERALLASREAWTGNLSGERLRTLAQPSTFVDALGIKLASS